MTISSAQAKGGKSNSCFEAFRIKLIGWDLELIFQDTIGIHSPIQAISISVNMLTLIFFSYINIDININIDISIYTLT